MRALLLLFLAAAIGCGQPGGEVSEPPGGAAPTADAFEAYLDAGVPPADGFDFPVGDPHGRGAYQDPATGRTHDGWYVATKFNEEYSLGLHPGEDWNGRGGGDTDLGQPVLTIAAGRVAFAGLVPGPWGNVVLVDHLVYENHERRVVRSVYAHLLAIAVREGDVVARRQPIGSIGKDPAGTFAAHLHLEIRYDLSLDPGYWPSSNGRDAAWIAEHYADPSEFITVRRSLFVPQRERDLVLVDTTTKRMWVRSDGASLGVFEIALGQADGPKLARDDLKTPRGMYFVVSKSRGPFSGPYAEFYGGHWIKIGYPNAYDAARGFREGLVTAAEAKRISDAWRARRLPWQGSRLGDGIGFHGWKGEWDVAGPRRLSFGCVVMQTRDVAAVFDRVPLGAMVVIF